MATSRAAPHARCKQRPATPPPLRTRARRPAAPQTRSSPFREAAAAFCLAAPCAPSSAPPSLHLPLPFQTSPRTRRAPHRARAGAGCRSCRSLVAHGRVHALGADSAHATPPPPPLAAASRRPARAAHLVRRDGHHEELGRGVEGGGVDRRLERRGRRADERPRRLHPRLRAAQLGRGDLRGARGAAERARADGQRNRALEWRADRAADWPYPAISHGRGDRPGPSCREGRRRATPSGQAATPRRRARTRRAPSSSPW